jgi:hypothetical protein
MSFDLSDLLRDWPYEPGQLQVRKVVGTDGREKLQLRLDMGVLQMEMQGRPDGREPHGAATELEHHMERARAAGEDFELTVDEIGELQAEGVQYYHRYLALFQLGDWLAVVRDTSAISRCSASSQNMRPTTTRAGPCKCSAPTC